MNVLRPWIDVKKAWLNGGGGGRGEGGRVWVTTNSSIFGLTRIRTYFDVHCSKT
jgi:hypothetical protein